MEEARPPLVMQFILKTFIANFQASTVPSHMIQLKSETISFQP